MDKLKLLSGNALKLIACASMLVDHIGLILFPNVLALRIVGRIAFPIFAFMIAEGARYTKSKPRYLVTMLICATICQLGYAFVSNSAYICVLVTFSISIILIYALQYFKKTLFTRDVTVIKIILTFLLFVGAVIVAFVLNKLQRVEYGFFGIMLPVVASLPHMPQEAPERIKRIDTPLVSVALSLVGLVPIALDSPFGWIQVFSALAIPLLLLYSGKRGALKLKYFFYIFYPAHIVALVGIGILIFR